MTWIDLKFAAALAMAGTVMAYAIAEEAAAFVLLGVGMLAASTGVWTLYRRGERTRRAEQRGRPPSAPLPRPANMIWWGSLVLLMAFMGWTLYRFRY